MEANSATSKSATKSALLLRAHKDTHEAQGLPVSPRTCWTQEGGTADCPPGMTQGEEFSQASWFEICCSNTCCL